MSLTSSTRQPNITLISAPDKYSPVYTDGLDNWFKFNGTGGSYSIFDCNLYIDVSILDSGKTSSRDNYLGSFITSTNSVIDRPGRFKVPSRENGDFYWNSEQIIKGYVTVPYNDNLLRYYNGSTTSYSELIYDPIFAKAATGDTSGQLLVNDGSGFDNFTFSTFYWSAWNATASANCYNVDDTSGGKLVIKSDQLGLTTSIVLNTLTPYYLDIDYQITRGAAAGFLNTTTASFNFNGTTYSVNNSLTGLYKFTKQINVGDITSLGIQSGLEISFQCTSGGIEVPSHCAILGVSVINGVSASKVASFINEDTNFGATISYSTGYSTAVNEANYPNLAVELNSNVKYKLNYGVEWNPNLTFRSISDYFGLAQINFDELSPIVFYDTIVITPDSSLYSYYSQTALAIVPDNTGTSSYVVTSIPYNTLFGSGGSASITGKITLIQHNVNDTEDLYGFNAVRSYEQADFDFGSKYALPISGAATHSSITQFNGRFLSAYGYDSDHCHQIVEGQGERGRFIADFSNSIPNLTSGAVDFWYIGGTSSGYTTGNLVSIPGGGIFSVFAVGGTAVGGSFVNPGYTCSVGTYLTTNITGTGVGFEITVIHIDPYDSNNTSLTVDIYDRNGVRQTALEKVNYKQFSTQTFKTTPQKFYTVQLFDNTNTIPINEGWKYNFKMNYNPISYSNDLKKYYQYGIKVINQIVLILMLGLNS